jgi:hypothetical protein
MVVTQLLLILPLSGFETKTLPTLNLSGYREQLIKDLIDLDDLKDE